MWVLFITTLANFLLFEIGSKQKVTPQNTCIRMLNSYSKNIANILLFFAQIIFKNTFKTSLRLLCHFTHAQIFIHIIVRYLLDILNVIFSHLVLFFPLIPFCWVQTQGLIPKTSFPHLLSISISLAFAGSSTFKTFFSNSSALYLLQTHYCFSSALLHYPLPDLLPLCSAVTSAFRLPLSQTRQICSHQRNSVLAIWTLIPQGLTWLSLSIGQVLAQMLPSLGGFYWPPYTGKPYSA